MRVLIVGGIYGVDPAYRETVPRTPETTLESGLRGRGYEVETCSHRSTFRSRDYDIVHIHHLGYGALRAALDDSQTPFVFTAHVFTRYNADYSTVRRLTLHEVFARADGVVALSNAQWKHEHVAQRLNGAIHRVIRNGIDPQPYIGDAARERGPGWRLLYVGQLIKVKRMDILIRAFALIRRSDVTLALAYHVDRELEAVRRLVVELGLSGRVEFMGKLSQVRLAAEYARAHALVLASDDEALPSAVTEALMSGTPVIATNVGSLAEQLAGFGLVVPRRDPEAFASAIESLLSRYYVYEQGREQMVGYARERFSVAGMVDGHEQLYAELKERSMPVRRRQSRRVGSTVLRAALFGQGFRQRLRGLRGSRQLLDQ